MTRSMILILLSFTYFSAFADPSTAAAASTVAVAAATSAQAPVAAPAAKTITSPTVAENATTPPAKPKLICEDATPLGSHIHQRICLTAEEAAARKKASRDALQRMQNSSANQTKTGGG